MRTNTPERVTVIGAGTMGTGIAQVAAQAGCPVQLFDENTSVLETSRDTIAKQLSVAVEKGKISSELMRETLLRIHSAATLKLGVKDSTFVIEAIVEDLEIKRSLFRTIAEHASPDCVFASNTSSIPLTKIAETIPHPERVIGMHFFNPVHIMSLVEVVTQKATDEKTLWRTLVLAKAMNKEPIVVRDSPGFASSRLGVVLGLEAMRMLEQGVASAEDIDKAMELGYKHPMGPLKLTDLVGLDVRLAIAETLHRELGGAQYAPPEILRRKVAAGELGKKSGQGFYTWSKLNEPK